MLYSIGDRVPAIDASAWIAASASVIGSVVMRAGSSVWFNAVVRADNDLIEIGANSNVQDAAVLHTDDRIPLVIGRDCTIGHQAMVHGCTIGDCTLVGIQSVILNHAVIGSHSMIGAGSLVTEGKQFPDGVLLLGRPAKVVRDLTPAELQFLQYGAQHYVDNARRFRDTLRELPTP